MKHAFVAAFALAILVTATARNAMAAEYDRFFGTFVGETSDISQGNELRRDLTVAISPTDDGFRVEWKTVSVKTDGRSKEKAYSIDFFPSQREHIYSSAMKANLFGGRQPLDPMKGDPYVWAHFEGDTLVINALLITDDGGYEMLTYNRTLVAEGLLLEFDRIYNGIPQKRVEATLTRVD